VENIEHVTKIDALIPQAEKVARGKVKALGKTSELRPGKNEKDYKHCFFSEFFHIEMTRLTIEAGLRIN